jgi:hypothetical protein
MILLKQDRQGASGPGNGQNIVIERTSSMSKHLQSHDMSLPLSSLVKGIRGKVWMGFGD